VLAKRTARKPVFERPPEQSDYVAIWNAHETPAEPLRANLARPRPSGRLPTRLREHVTQPVLLWLNWDFMPRVVPLLDPFARRRTRRERSVANGRLFRRLD